MERVIYGSPKNSGGAPKNDLGARTFPDGAGKNKLPQPLKFPCTPIFAVGKQGNEKSRGSFLFRARKKINAAATFSEREPKNFLGARSFVLCARNFHEGERKITLDERKIILGARSFIIGSHKTSKKVTAVY